MAQCSGPISPAENPPGPSGLNQVEQEKEKSPQQPSRSGLFENVDQEYIENAENFMETDRLQTEFETRATPGMYQDSDSDDGLDVVYGSNSNPPSGSSMIQRPIYNQDCATNTTSCTVPRPSTRRSYHEGEHYGYSYPAYPRLSRMHPQGYSTYYDHPPSFRPSRYISIPDWPEGSQSSQSGSRYPHSDPHDPYDLGYPPILRHPPARHRPRRHNLDVANPRIPYHTRSIPEIDMDFLDFDQMPPTSMAEGIRRSAPNPEVMHPIRQEQQRQVIMRHASTSTPPMPSLRQHASTSTQPSAETNERKRAGSTTESSDEVSAKKPKVDDTPQPISQETVTHNTENVTLGASTDQPNDDASDASLEAPIPTAPEQSSDFLLCTENLPGEALLSEVGEIPPVSHQSVPTPSNTSENVDNVASSENQQDVTVTVTTSTGASTGQSKSVITTTTKSSGTRTETRTVPASAIEFVTSTLKPRSKPGSSQTSRKTSPNTSRASPVHVAAYSQEALRDLVCATLAPAAAANLIKSEKREKKDRESSTRTSSDPIDDPQPGPSGLQRVQSTEEMPGPSGTQQQSSPSSDLEADDLQLDCLSSDTEGSSSEDVQVVKISRRKKSSKKPVEVDLTQEMTSDDDGEVVIEEVRSRPVSVPEHTEAEDPENKTEITVKTFASVPENVTNIQSSSRGSTPAAPTTLFDTYQQQMASSTGADSAWAGTVPPPYHHRDHGYHRHNRHSEPQPDAVRQSRNSPEPQMQGIRPVDLRPEDPVVMETLDERTEAATADPWLHDDYRPQRLRQPCVWRQSSSQTCPSGCPCSRLAGRHRHNAGWSSLGMGSRLPPQTHRSGNQSQYTNPPPAHRASLCPNTNAMDPHNNLSSSQMTGSRPGSLLRAVQRMNPRHQRLYHMQQQTTEQQRRWSVRAPPPPYPSTAMNAAAAAEDPQLQHQPQAASATACTSESSSSTPQHQEQRGRHQQHQPTATSHTSGHLLSVPRVIMSRPTHPPFMHLRRGHSHNSTNPQYMGPPNQSVPPPPLAGRGGQGPPLVDPPPAHQPPPPRFPEEVQLPDSRRARPRRWHIPTMGDPHPPYHHPEVEPVPLVMDHPMYHPPLYPSNMIPPNAHHGSMGPVMDPHQLEGVPPGRDNLAYGPMLNILFQPHRMGGLEVNMTLKQQPILNLYFSLGIYEVVGG